MNDLRNASPQVKRFLAGALLNSLGGGLTLPVLVIYLNQVRGISLAAASLVLSWMAITGLVYSPIIGHLVDKFGPRRVMLIAILIEATATLLWVFVTDLQSALLVGALASLGHSAIWPPQTTMMARMVSEDFRPKFFGLQFMMLNLGLGLGGVFSSLIVNVDDPSSFTRLYVIDSFTFLIYFAFILSLRGVGGRIEKTKEDIENDGGYRQIAADHKFMRLTLAKLLMITFGYASLEAGLPALLTLFGDLSVKALGPIWAVNTGVIVLGQIFVINRLEGRSRIRLLFLVSVIWTIAWLLIGFSVSLDPTATFILAAVGIGIFALGEMIWSPILPSVVNQLAPEHLRGRYNAAGTNAWQISLIAGPTFAGTLLGFNAHWYWLAGLIAGLIVISIAASRLKLPDRPTVNMPK